MRALLLLLCLLSPVVEAKGQGGSNSFSSASRAPASFDEVEVFDIAKITSTIEVGRCPVELPKGHTVGHWEVRPHSSGPWCTFKGRFGYDNSFAYSTGVAAKVEWLPVKSVIKPGYEQAGVDLIYDRYGNLTKAIIFWRKL